MSLTESPYDLFRYVMYNYICMNLWGVAVLNLDSHPDHNKEPYHAPYASPKTITRVGYIRY